MKKIKAKANAPATLNRWKSVIKDEALVQLLKKPLLETHAEDLLKALETGTVSTNVFLRRIHNFAVGVGWLPWPIVPKKLWPQFKFQPKRAITEKEHH